MKIRLPKPLLIVGMLLMLWQMVLQPLGSFPHYIFPSPTISCRAAVVHTRRAALAAYASHVVRNPLRTVVRLSVWVDFGVVALIFLVKFLPCYCRFWSFRKRSPGLLSHRCLECRGLAMEWHPKL